MNFLVILASLAIGMLHAGAFEKNRSADTSAAPRTYYESLDMSSPRSTVETFIDAWKRQDYQTAYFLFSPRAEEGLLQVLGSFGFEQIIPGFDDDDLEASPLLPHEGTRMPSEFMYDLSQAFDALMIGAAKQDKLSFILSDDALFGAETTQLDGSVNYQVETGGRPAELKMVLIQLPSGRWKIDRIVWDGSSPNDRPWGVEGG